LAATTDEPVSFATRDFYRAAPGARLYGLFLFAELAKMGGATQGLRRLAELVAAGRLDPQVDFIAPWTEAERAIEALLDRRVAGKAVLTIA
jgi:NADPH:quinone reductase-like Zn-dependent oxidoreductase